MATMTMIIITIAAVMVTIAVFMTSTTMFMMMRAMAIMGGGDQDDGDDLYDVLGNFEPFSKCNVVKTRKT